ncbi:hypothetical protein [Streptomyces umbrinus]|uniref:hypothetical protein n=1 Tax=Streptomyces umbrinus TaxID=67370 RepID=UPI0033D9DBD5
MRTRSHSLRQASKPLRDLADPDSIRATGPPPPDTAPPSKNGPAKPGTPTEASAEALRDALTHPRRATAPNAPKPHEAPPSPTQTPPSSVVTPPGPTEAAAETAPYHRAQQLPHQQPPPRHPTDE